MFVLWVPSSFFFFLSVLMDLHFTFFPFFLSLLLFAYVYSPLQTSLLLTILIKLFSSFDHVAIKYEDLSTLILFVFSTFDWRLMYWSVYYMDF